MGVDLLRFSEVDYSSYFNYTAIGAIVDNDLIDIFLTAQINLPPGTLFLLGVSYAISVLDTPLVSPLTACEA
jgi:hypothetical protein